MKKESILSLLGITFLMCLFSCTSEDLTNDQEGVNESEVAEILQIGEQVGKMHSEGLSFILEELKKSPSSKISSDHKVGYVVKAANKFIQSKYGTKTRIANGLPTDQFPQEYVINSTLTLNKQTFQQITNEDMKRQMSPTELYYVNYVENNIEILTLGGNFNSLKFNAARDSRMTAAQRKGIVCFISTAEDSYHYWNDNALEWERQVSEYTPIISVPAFRWKMVVFSDAYWGWIGMISSGLNPIVGGGAAVAGSGIAFFN